MMLNVKLLMLIHYFLSVLYNCLVYLGWFFRDWDWFYLTLSDFPEFFKPAILSSSSYHLKTEGETENTQEAIE